MWVNVSVRRGLGEDIFLLFFRGTGRVLSGVSNVWAEISSSYNTLPTRSKIRLLVFRLVLVFSCTNIHPTPGSLLEDPKSENGSFSTDSQIDHILNRLLKYLITPKKAWKHKEKGKMEEGKWEGLVHTRKPQKEHFSRAFAQLGTGPPKCPKFLKFAEIFCTIYSLLNLTKFN